MLQPGGIRMEQMLLLCYEIIQTPYDACGLANAMTSDYINSPISYYAPELAFSVVQEGISSFFVVITY